MEGISALRSISPADFFRSKLYLSRYPAIAHMLQESGINHLWRNVFDRCGRIFTGNPDYLDRLETGCLRRTIRG